MDDLDGNSFEVKSVGNLCATAGGASEVAGQSWNPVGS